jgi:hypothetical protein
MAWGSDANTEEELEKLAAVRGYFQQQFPGASIRDSYDAGRMAQVFRIETDDVGELRDLRAGRDEAGLEETGCRRAHEERRLERSRRHELDFQSR